MKVLMIGMNESCIAAFNRADASAEYELYVLEEKEIYNSSQHTEHSIIKDVRFCAYQQSTECIKTGIRWHREIVFDAIIPGTEYGVLGAYGIAAALNLSNPGDTAIRVCTDKLEMRKVCQKLGMLTPRFSRVKTSDEVSAFFVSQPIILKPANRHASLGVVIISSLKEIESSWIETTSTDEKNTAVKERALHWDYLVEDYIEGYEVSVETLVQDGKIIFHNITWYESTKGKYFVEMKHIVPAPVPSKDEILITSSVEQFLSGISAATGLFHSEWRVSSEGPYMLECAARFPGDKIPILIESVYNFNLIDAWVKLLLGRELSLPTKAIGVAAIQYFSSEQGQLMRIDGIHNAKNHPDVIDLKVNIEPGDQVIEIKNAMSRPGFVIVKAETLQKLNKSLEEVVANVNFVINNKES